ncbi:MAG: uroporphyrinogen-III C-methyltransferase [Hamadaea sp.]|uniref:uroporphyrinogen-III C-methyltransferase n=1 Tax=Hamadaea sp. TaxID=2024425 RepID=UPI001854973D|nr:uroporphyrinogen-III C-methyltransferase [Hamadaea sp.]NUR71084.1 uroporphyrinogen-III C-methyltransferase [Hamadaea sp.]NUT21893.1 uroporphyrinogen-III C-methyltransferase [Hamadaea sp.]
MSTLYPLGLRLEGRRVVVVGGGAIATRRIPALLEAGADVLVVAPVLTPALQGLAGRFEWRARLFEPSDLDGAWLVHVAVDDPAAAAEVSAVAEELRVFCVRADDRHAATAWTPAVTRHGQVTVAVLGGGSPRLSMSVRDRIATLLASTTDTDRLPGTVALVGGGPGDAELITVKGRRLLNAADVVVADRLAPGVLLDELRPEVEVVDVAKLPYGAAAAQEHINDLLVERALAGKFVVRLKGGDPFVFGRGGEEALACAEAGVPVVVVPGVSSAISVPAVAGIPVTHRGITHEFTVVSGHVAPSSAQSLVDWTALGRSRGTIVVLMGLRHLAEIAATLIREGRDPQTPAAAIQEGTTSQQIVVRAPLTSIAEAAGDLRTPVITVIGEVVSALLSGSAPFADS